MASGNRMQDFKEYGDQLRTGDQAEFWKKNRNEIVYYGAQAGDAAVMTQLRRVRDQLGELNQAMVWVQQTRTMTPGQKTARLNELREHRDGLARAVFERGFHPMDKNAAF